MKVEADWHSADERKRRKIRSVNEFEAFSLHDAVRLPIRIANACKIIASCHRQVPDEVDPASAGSAALATA